MKESSVKEGAPDRQPAARERLEETSTPRLVAEIGAQTKALAEKHWELAFAELKADLASDLSALRGFGIGALAAVLGLNTLITAGVLALALVWRGWLAGLVVAAPLLATAALSAYVAYRRFETPLARTRRALRRDVTLAREHLG